MNSVERRDRATYKVDAHHHDAEEEGEHGEPRAEDLRCSGLAIEHAAERVFAGAFAA